MEVQFAAVWLHHVQQILGLFRRVALQTRLMVDPPVGHVAHQQVMIWDLSESLFERHPALHLV